MKIKVVDFPNGKKAYIQEGKRFSTGANLSDSFTLEVNGQKPTRETEANVPEDFFEDATRYEFEEGRQGRTQRKVLRVKHTEAYKEKIRQEKENNKEKVR